MKLRHIARIAGTSVCALAIAAAAAAGATRMNAASVNVVLTHRGPSISGPTDWRPGAVRINATSRLADQEVTLLHFRPGYSYAQFRADGQKAQGRGPAARAAVKRVFAHVIFAGGLNLFRGQSASFTVTVAPGVYYLGEMTRQPQLTKIHVRGTPAKASVHRAGTIRATNHAYQISGRLPARGTLTFTNLGTEPQRLNLIPVERGTTRAQVVSYIRKAGVGENAPPPPFALKGPQLGTAELSPHRRMQLTYRLPAGRYVALDLDTDMRTGRSAALEGLVAVVNLR